jgi:hypothetical protein
VVARLLRREESQGSIRRHGKAKMDQARRRGERSRVWEGTKSMGANAGAGEGEGRGAGELMRIQGRGRREE